MTIKEYLEKNKAITTLSEVQLNAVLTFKKKHSIYVFRSFVGDLVTSKLISPKEFNDLVEISD